MTASSPDLPPRPPNWDDLKVFEDHPELHHYTTLGGLTGIIQTNTLWATHFGDLNDASELMVIREPLIAELTASFRELIQVRRRQRLSVDRAVKAVGGLQRAADESARKMIALLYASTFTSEEGLEGVKELNGPVFITSFCSHTNEAYERDNGLLSQWRGYGGTGGFAIVLDSRGLLDLLDREHSTHSYMKMSINEAIYLYPNRAVSDAFPKLRQTCDTLMEALLDGNIKDWPSDVFSDFIHAALSCKHHAFHEEREIRLAVQPATEGWRKAISDEGKGKYNVPPAKVPREAGGLTRAVLFEGLGVKLPIKRVIVGPSVDQQQSLRRARALLGPDVPVVLSETPYVNRSRPPEKVA